jgi:hypothetical protein
MMQTTPYLRDECRAMAQLLDRYLYDRDLCSLLSTCDTDYNVVPARRMPRHGSTYGQVWQIYAQYLWYTQQCRTCATNAAPWLNFWTGIITDLCSVPMIQNYNVVPARQMLRHGSVFGQVLLQIYAQYLWYKTTMSYLRDKCCSMAQLMDKYDRSMLSTGMRQTTMSYLPDKWCSMAQLMDRYGRSMYAQYLWYKTTMSYLRDKCRAMAQLIDRYMTDIYAQYDTEYNVVPARRMPRLNSTYGQVYDR